MPGLIPYLLKLSAALALAYVFYRLILRPLTFYVWNRWYLLGYTFLSIWIPFIDISSFSAAHTIERISLVKYIPTVGDYQSKTRGLWTTAPAVHFSYHQLILLCLMVGSLFFLARLVMRFLSLKKIRSRSLRINQGGAEIYQVDADILPFSFGKSIYVNRNLHSEAELKEIILHEYVHVRQQHSIDIIWSELLTIVNWYNPFAWLLRHAIRQNLEFIADENVLKSGVDRKSYQYHLLQVIGLNPYRIANNFNSSSLKKRITMMNKLRSASAQLFKFLFVMPLLVLALIGFRSRDLRSFNTFETRDTVPAAKAPVLLLDSQEAPPVPDITVEEPILPPPTPDLPRCITTDTDKKLATITLPNGKKEIYHLDRPNEKKLFDEKYGNAIEFQKKAMDIRIQDAIIKEKMMKEQTERMAYQNLYNQKINEKLIAEAMLNEELDRRKIDMQMQIQKGLSDETLRKLRDTLSATGQKYENEEAAIELSHKSKELAELYQLDAMKLQAGRQSKMQIIQEKRQLEQQEIMMKNELRSLQEKQIELEKRLRALEKKQS